MPARATERFGNELQDYEMQILGFWGIHSMVSSVSTGSHRTGGLVAQGLLRYLTSHWTDEEQTLIPEHSQSQGQEARMCPKMQRDPEAWM